MSAISAQPSPFGRLTRERHIEWTVNPTGQKFSFPEPSVEETSHRPVGQIWEAPSESEGVPRILSPLATHPEGARDQSPNRDAWAHPKTAQPGRRCQGVQDFALGPLAGKGREREERRSAQLPVASRYPGLGLLAGIRRVCITVKADGFVRSPQRRSYIISCTALGREVFVATEDCNACCFHLCGPARPCHLCLRDQGGHVLLWFCRPFRLGLACLPGCQMEMKAYTSDNELVGTVRQRPKLFSHLLEVCDAQGLATLLIHGSWASSRCFTEQEFQVLSSTDSVVATIWKKWPGFNEERNMDHETFGMDVGASDTIYWATEEEE
ncbi:hypothetical protein JRQ81_017695 [Phrynocephalus forsythii]|uniref:Phospholipid scramblase n=1 Tax=Phrynocephalus forsythii TaxID=171643 RepID=A0A9Q0XQU1_9SAUR|nr:hypothetical protein JRQ81_017695 [Phrynocephalus forsythii]